MELGTLEVRILGALVEKQLTTPQQYPLSLNSLVVACNQSTNRDPVMVVAEDEVVLGLDRLRDLHLVRFVLPSHGRSVVRYRHVIDEQFAIEEAEVALLAMLFLRGPQTVGELRMRAERMAVFDSLSEAESTLEHMASAEVPTVSRQVRRPGQKEDRWTHLLSGMSVGNLGGFDSDGGSGGIDRSQRDPGFTEEDREADRYERLRSEVDDLRGELVSLREDFGELRESLGG